MKTVSLNKIVKLCDQTLDSSISDYPGAVNGLQVENSGKIHKVGAAVDAMESTIKLAIEQKVNLLVVHHGLFWNSSHPWTGKRYHLLKLLLENDVAVYSSHLPLDAHPQIGNNILLCRALKLKKLEPFYEEKGKFLSFKGESKESREDLKGRLEKILRGRVHIAPGGPKMCRKIGVVTGGAGSELRRAAAEGIDTFITGEGPHWSFGLAEELGINVFYGGHYATETFGVKALAERISKKFKIPWCFIDYPSGL